jgi:hypothetical protein
MFGALFFLVASGTVVVCKNNTRVLGSIGPEQGKHKNSLTSRDIIRYDTMIALFRDASHHPATMPMRSKAPTI